MKRSIIVGVIVTSAAAVALIAATGVTQHPTPKPFLAWSKGRPRLVCPTPSSGAIYDGSGLSSIKDPKDAVVQVFPDLGQGYPWPPDVVAQVTRDDLEQVWYDRTDQGATSSIALKIDGTYYALYDVGRYLFAGGEPISWRDSGWTVGDSSICQFQTESGE
jgi:hypothetical protein